MEAASHVPTAVYVIWWITLAVVFFVMVPIAIYWLNRALRAARGVRGYTEEMLAAGLAIAGNTGSISALGETVAVAGEMVETAERLQSDSLTIADILARRASEESGQ